MEPGNGTRKWNQEMEPENGTRNWNQETELENGTRKMCWDNFNPAKRCKPSLNFKGRRPRPAPNAFQRLFHMCPHNK